MKLKIKPLVFSLLLFFITNNTKASSLIIEHVNTGSLASEISTTLGSDLASNYTEIIVNGVSLNMEDCRSISTTFPLIQLIDLSGTSFEGDLLPSSEVANTAAFGLLSKLNTFILPNSTTSIGDFAFYGCGKLASINLVETQIKTIGNYSFWGNTALVIPNFPSTLEKIGSYTFEVCNSIGDINFPPLLVSIGESAFYGCANITSLTFPLSLTTISEGAFENCTQLTSIYAPWATPISVGTKTFIGDIEFVMNITVHVTEGKTATYKTFPVWQDMKYVEDLPTSINGIKDSKNIEYSYQTSTLKVKEMQGKYLDVFDVASGKLIEHKYISSNDFRHDIQKLANNIYIAKVSDITLKFVR